MRIRYALLAERQIIDQRSNVASILGVIEEVTLQKPPGVAIPVSGMVHIGAVFCVLLEAETEVECNSNPVGFFWIEGPNGDTVFEHQLDPISMQGKPRTRLGLGVPIIPYHGAGTYRANIIFGDVAASWTFDLIVVESQAVVTGNVTGHADVPASAS